jgi:hypothetical protein
MPWEGLWLSSKGNHTMSGWSVSRNPSGSSSKLPIHLRASSSAVTRDIAYSRSPTASRASAWLLNHSKRTAFPLRRVQM